MKITADTNVLLRTLLPDDEGQRGAAIDALKSADLVAISIHSLCELAWVLAQSYGTARSDIAATIRKLVETENVVTNRLAVTAGLNVLDAGGDFADGVIAHEGHGLGGETFVSFDRKAVKLLAASGRATHLLT